MRKQTPRLEENMYLFIRTRHALATRNIDFNFEI